MTQDEIQKLVELEKAATPGPWGIDMYGNIARGDMNDPDESFPIDQPGDSEFIAAARNALPQLLKEREVLVKALKFYATPSRDQSFEGWQKEWRYVKIEKESDYEFYPNHNTAVEALREVGEIE